MGNQVSKPFWQGVAVQDDRVIHDNLMAKNDAVTPSTYYQRNPRPGVPTSNQKTHLTLEASNEQGQDGHLTIQTTRAGHPLPEQAGFVWKNVESDDEWRGWDGYQAITGFREVRCTSSIVDNHELTIIRLHSGKLLMAGINPNLVSQPKLLYRYDPDDSSMTELTLTLDGPIGTGSAARGPGLVQLPTGRVLFYIQTDEGDQIDAYYSDDEGDTWAVYSMRVLNELLEDYYGEIPSVDQITVAYQGGQLCMVIEAEDTQDTTTNNGAERLHQFYQYASDDLGQNFIFVEGMLDYSTADHRTAIRASRFPKVLAVPAGGFILGFYEKFNVVGEPEASDHSQYVCRRVGNAYQPFSSIPDEEIYQLHSQTGAATDLQIGFTMWFDEDGILYALVVDDLNSGSDGVPAEGQERISYLICQSWFYGTDWQEWTSWTVQTDTNLAFMYGFDCECTSGRTLCVHRWEADVEQPEVPYADGSVCAMMLGGFSEHTLPVQEDSDWYRDRDYIGWGDSRDGNFLAGRSWIPWAYPQQMGWTNGGAGGTKTLTCDLNIATAGAQNDYFSINANPYPNDGVIAEFEFKLNSAGNVNATETCFYLRLGDGATYDYRLIFRLASTGFRVYDANIPFGVANVTFDLTQWTAIRVVMDHSGSEKFRCWYRHTEGSHHREWTEGPTGDLTVRAAGPFVVDSVIWGHYGAAANDTDWKRAHYNFFPGRWTFRSAEDPANDWEVPEDLHPQSYSTVGPYLIDDGVKMRASSGPTRIGETFDIEADYDYPVTALDPRLSPSPQRPYRSDEDEHEMTFVWEMRSGAGSIWMDNYPILAYVLNSNIREFYVDGYDGAWNVIGHAEADSGWNNLSWERRNERVRPDSTSATHGTYYLYHQAHVGDTMLLKRTNGEEVFLPYRIRQNSEGAWYSDGAGGIATKIPTITLDEDQVLADPPDTSGTGARIWRTNFGIVIPNNVGFAYRRIRLRIPSHRTADGYYQIGNFYLGPIFLFGQSYDNQWSIEERQNVDLLERGDGLRRSRVLGRRRRVVSVSLANTAIDLCPTQSSNPSPNYVSTVTGTANAAGTPHDVTRTIMGVVNMAQGSHTPICLLRYVPEWDARHVYPLTKTLDTHYGRVVTDPSVDNVVGTELVNEAERMSSITIEEEI